MDETNHKRPDFIWHSRDPLNGGSPLHTLIEDAHTPTNRFFVRNHGLIPDIDPQAWRLHIAVGDTHIEKRFDDLRGNDPDLPLHQVTAVLQCAGNRRTDLQRVAPIPNEILWGDEAVGSALWRGVRLRDLLFSVSGDALDQYDHVHFKGVDTSEKEGKITRFGASIPLAKALNADTLLATHMNGAPLLPIHGFPMRVIVPGYIGARSVKWLTHISLHHEPSPNYYQRHAYRLFSGSATPENADWERAPMLYEMPVNALICTPQSNIAVKSGAVEIRGVAWVGGGRSVVRVEIAIDEGAWQEAAIETPDNVAADERNYGWIRWYLTASLAVGTHEIAVRAWDSAANTQPAHAADIWNFKGYMNNAIHRVQITVE